MEKEKECSDALQPLFSEFINENGNFPEHVSTATSKPITKKRKRMKSRNTNDSESEESSESDEDQEEIENQNKEEVKEETPAWLRYLPPRRFIKVTTRPNQHLQTNNNETRMSMEVVKESSLLEEKDQSQGAKRMKYVSHNATETAALLSFFTFKSGEEQQSPPTPALSEKETE